MIDVRITGRMPKGIDRADILRAILGVFQSVRRSPTGTISIAFISDAEMQILNRTWRHKDRTTDVLSFAPPPMPVIGDVPMHWGDIFVSPVTVRAEAKRRSIDFSEEVLRMIVHGMLHLFGYDHATEEEEIRMFSLQERVLARLMKLS